MIKIGELVKVIDQDIIGRVVYNDGSHIVIEDLDSEFPSPDNTLEYHASEIEELNDEALQGLNKRGVIA